MSSPAHITGIQFTNITATLKHAQFGIGKCDTFSPIDTPPEVTITSTLLSADCIRASSESGLLTKSSDNYLTDW